MKSSEIGKGKIGKFMYILPQALSTFQIWDFLKSGVYFI